MKAHAERVMFLGSFPLLNQSELSIHTAVWPILSGKIACFVWESADQFESVIIDEVRCRYVSPQSTFTITELEPIYLRGKGALALIEYGAGSAAKKSIMQRIRLAGRILLGRATPDHLRPLLVSSVREDREWGLKQAPLIKPAAPKF